MSRVIAEPQENIYLAPGDVISVVFKPLSFVALGAVSKNEEIAFEADGISLIQALGRVSGLRDNQADARGVFLFRFEDAAVVPGFAVGSTGMTTGVVYRFDLRKHPHYQK